MIHVQARAVLWAQAMLCSIEAAGRRRDWLW